MNHTSINTSALFVICMCCDPSIYGLTVTRASTVIYPGQRLTSATVAVLNTRVFVHCGAVILDVWSLSGVFSWWFEHLLVGYQKEYFGWHMMHIE